MGVLDKALQNLVRITAEKTAWENASPGSTFLGQTINILELQDYERVYIRAKYSTGAYQSYDIEIPTEVGTVANIAIAVNSISTRDVTIGSNKITFGNGQIVNSYGGSTTQNNSLSIPLEIVLKRKKAEV